LFVDDFFFFFLEGTRIHVFKIDNKGLWIRPPLHMLTRFRDIRRLILTFRFHSKSILSHV